MSRWFKNFSNTSNQGYTLIEILVTVTIMLLLVGGGIVSYVRFNDRQTMIGTARELQGLLRAAQTKARVGDRPEGCDHLRAYVLRLAAQSSTVNLIADCDNSEIIKETIELDSNITAQSAVDIQFQALHGGVITPQTITLQSAGGMGYEFLVSKGGEISEGAFTGDDNLIASSNPSPSPTAAASPGASPTPTSSPSTGSLAGDWQQYLESQSWTDPSEIMAYWAALVCQYLGICS